MITLKKNEEIEIFQVELALKLKTKQSPFISILILAKEQEEISAETLKENLLPSLPVKACENLLKRLEQQGYLQKEQNNMFGYRQTHFDNIDKYLLTDFGQKSAIDKSFWIGEKGVYNVFVSKSSLIMQQIIRTEKVERAENNSNSILIKTPREIKQYENKILTINKTEVLIEDVEEICFQLKSAHGILEIKTKLDETALILSKENQLLFQTDLEIEENILQEDILLSCKEIDYDHNKKGILTEFSKDNLSFNRKLIIEKPLFREIQFNQVELENILHIPTDKENAELWYWEVLYKNMNEYFLDENSLKEFATELVKPFQLHFKMKVPNRAELTAIFSEREDTFYEIAKLETINFLNY